MSIKKIISGICGIVLGVNCLVARAEDTSSVVQKIDWEKRFNARYDGLACYNFLAYIYSDNSIEITGLCYSNLNPKQAPQYYIMSDLTFNDFLYEIRIEPSYYWIASFRDNKNNSITYDFERTNSSATKGDSIIIYLTPRTSFTEETTITAFGQEIIINSGNAKSQEADFNQDGAVNAEDAALILQYSGEFGSGFTELTFDEWSKQTIPNSES